MWVGSTFFFYFWPDWTGFDYNLMYWYGIRDWNWRCRFYWFLLVFNGFYWFLLGFIGFYWVLLGFIGFYWVFTNSVQNLPGLTEFSIDFTRCYWMWGGSTFFFYFWPDWTGFGYNWMYWYGIWDWNWRCVGVWNRYAALREIMEQDLAVGQEVVFEADFEGAAAVLTPHDSTSATSATSAEIAPPPPPPGGESAASSLNDLFFVSFRQVLPGFTWFLYFLPACTGFRWILLGFEDFYWVLVVFTRF